MYNLLSNCHKYIYRDTPSRSEYFQLLLAVGLQQKTTVLYSRNLPVKRHITAVFHSPIHLYILLWIVNYFVTFWSKKIGEVAKLSTTTLKFLVSHQLSHFFHKLLIGCTADSAVTTGTDSVPASTAGGPTNVPATTTAATAGSTKPRPGHTPYCPEAAAGTGSSSPSCCSRPSPSSCTATATSNHCKLNVTVQPRILHVLWESFTEVYLLNLELLWSK